MFNGMIVVDVDVVAVAVMNIMLSETAPSFITHKNNL